MSLFWDEDINDVAEVTSSEQVSRDELVRRRDEAKDLLAEYENDIVQYDTLQADNATPAAATDAPADVASEVPAAYAPLVDPTPAPAAPAAPAVPVAATDATPAAPVDATPVAVADPPADSTPAVAADPAPAPAAFAAAPDPAATVVPPVSV